MNIEEFVDTIASQDLDMSKSDFAKNVRKYSLYEVKDFAIEHGWQVLCSGSIDDAMLFTDATIPVCEVKIEYGPAGSSARVIHWPQGLSKPEIMAKGEGNADTPAMALLVAAIMALTKG